MQLGINFEEVFSHWVELKKAEGIVYLNSVRRDKNTLELFDSDGSDYRVEFEDWLQNLIFEEIKEDCDAIDWDATAQHIAESVNGSYHSLKKGEDSCS
ncbi:hypothetical protein [Microcoleus sp. D2_18a_B4]|uniref:hypothetical protein n=1 Tax=Microcoleus sp. D2_18a_B4 TaxID=3055329 RepID=UPI002FD34263